MTSAELCDLVVDGMTEKKAEDVVVLDLQGVNNAIASYFVICSGNSDTHVEAISDSIEEVVYKRSNQSPWHREGVQNKEWILIDYVDVVVHIFKKEKRSFYALEDLWGDAVISHIETSA
ncbi:ribosome silencing factor [Fulvivirgaceae bacterium BMA10]|uniref:Ribosomal silencing factor RsfS n=1 Tax=Splendidivirga corallicola TaxID=3051826 RepID=A0ABT8KXT6_9BACT|nr:ribosome silencing factor [Fulvivirgaceae bacterium BMA10]